MSRPRGGDRARLVAALSRPRLEILALPGAADQVREHVPRNLPITVTSSPRRGLEPTIALAEELARRGHDAVPHLAARQVRDEAHLRDVLQRLSGVGIRDLFVVAGDAPRPVGAFHDALALLQGIDRLRRDGAVSGFVRIGIAGYPAGHPLIPDSALWQALRDKQPLASYLVTQMCFDSTAILAWTSQARREGVRLPVHAGVPGVVDHAKLLRIAGRIGVGESAGFLRKHRHGLMRLVMPGGYRPDRLVERLTAGADQPIGADDTSGGLTGLHLYTLGDIAATERWRRRTLDRLTSGAAGA